MLLTAACKPGNENNDANIRRMEDTLFKLYPTTNRVSVEIKDFSDVTITIGDMELYEAPDAKRQGVSKEIEGITRKIFSEGNDLNKGEVVFVKEENSIDVKSDKKTYPMQLK
ncbi:MAG: hypothetical protein EOP51_07840 [Sphingobacteriales bacterium]|nr:MAG: hypothetical protein EOP51_07840 [Sphingobacteriales bacterium]